MGKEQDGGRDDAPRKARPAITGRGEQRREERFARQASALRANLQRRKAQLRARDDVAAQEAGVVDADIPSKSEEPSS